MLTLLLAGCAGGAATSTPGITEILRPGSTTTAGGRQPSQTAAPPLTATASPSPSETSMPSSTATAAPSPLPGEPAASPTAGPAATRRPPTTRPTVVVTKPDPSASPTSAPTSAFSYQFPIRPASEASYGRCHHDYPASDIFIPIGSEFVAVVDGVVDYVSHEDSWDPAIDDPATRGGLSVAIIGVDGVRYYGSHLSEIAPGIVAGAQVRAGDLLGYTGQSGSARPTPPHLHFGISRPSTPDDWATRRGEINPYRYLNSWRQGINQTPELVVTGEGAC